MLGAIALVVLGQLTDAFLGELPLLSELSSAQRRNTFPAIPVAVFLIVEPFGSFGIWMPKEFNFTAWPFRH